MLRKAFIVWMLIVLLMGATVVAGSEGISQVQIRFDYNHMATIASNQFALWVEDNDGKLIKTIYVTGFTGTRRGYRNREMSLPHWVKAADPENMTDDAMDCN